MTRKTRHPGEERRRREREHNSQGGDRETTAREGEREKWMGENSLLVYVYLTLHNTST